jgi:predicted nucleic acid-binding protein
LCDRAIERNPPRLIAAPAVNPDQDMKKVSATPSPNLNINAHTAILMREHGIRRICTRDTDFHQFAFLEVIDPLRS